MNVRSDLLAIGVIVVAIRQALSEAQKSAWSWAMSRGLMPLPRRGSTPEPLPTALHRACMRVSLRQGFFAAAWGALAVSAAASADFILGRGGL